MKIKSEDDGCILMLIFLPAVTGMDAIISQIKDGTVTLRKRRRKTQTNAALQEMFQMLEISRKQNRNSNILVSSQLNVVLSSPKAATEDVL